MSYGHYALIAVDVQYDFLPGGSLAVTDGDQILLPLRQIAQGASLVITSRDWHPDNHFSFSEHPRYDDGSWPAHCVQKTKGAKIHPSIAKLANFTISKGTNPNGPDQYSAFAGKTLRPVETLEEILQRSPIQTVVVGGLALDYCVKWTALDASAMGYRTVVPLNATKGVAPFGSQQALLDFKAAGVETVDYFTT